MTTYKDICRLLAAKNLYEAGVEPKEIARQAGVSESTIHKWLRTSGARRK